MNMRIVSEEWYIGAACQVMDFSLGQLLMQASNDWGCQYNVAN